MSRLVVLFLALSGVAAAQTPVRLDFGVLGGVLLNNSFSENQLCSGAGCTFSKSSFTADVLRGTVGPTVGALINGHVEIQFEAVHRSVGYQVTTDVTLGPALSHTVESVHGNFWEYPLLATYHFGSGTTRAYAGGGLAMGTSGKITSDFQFTNTNLTPNGPVTTTSFFSRTNSLSSNSVFYLNAGVDAKVSYFSIRPEFRYSRFPYDSESSSEAILTPNQFELILGVVVHPFHSKK
jgi:hypothetical protein